MFGNILSSLLPRTNKKNMEEQISYLIKILQRRLAATPMTSKPHSVPLTACLLWFS